MKRMERLSVAPSSTVLRPSVALRAGALASLGVVLLMLFSGVSAASLALGHANARAAPVAVHLGSAPGVVGTTVAGPGHVAPGSLIGPRPLLSRPVGIPQQGLLNGLPRAEHTYARALAAHPLQSTASNLFVANYSVDSSIVQNGASNQSFAVAVTDYYAFVNGTSIAGFPGAPSATFWQDGLDAVATTTTGGSGWNSWSWLNPASSWVVPGTGCGATPECGDIHIGNGVAASDGAGTVLVADVYGQPCYEFGAQSLALCNSTVNVTAPTGIAVDRSTTGGASFSAAVEISGYSPETYVNAYIGTCGGVVAGFLPGNFTFGTPSIQINPTNGYAVVTWAEEFNHALGIYCSGGQAYYNATAPQVFVYSSTSTDGGQTWSAPMHHGANQTAYVTNAIGPAPNYRNYLAFPDYNNASTSSVPFAFSTSTDNGSTWSKSADLIGLGVVPVFGIPPDDYPGQVSYLHLAVDTVSVAHKGTLYMVWADNRSSGNEPSVAFSKSGDQGAHWSSMTYLTPNTTATAYAIPQIAIQPNGDVWVTFYAVDTSSGSYFEDGVMSSNGGATWTQPFQVSDVASVQIPAPYEEFGSVQGVIATTAGAYPAWVDCRSANCPLAGDNEVFTANLNPVTITTNISATDTVNATVNTLGSISTTSVGPSGGLTVLETGASASVQVPFFAPGTPTSVYEFSNWSGLSTSTNDPTTFTYLGAGSLQANYASVPSSWIIGNVGPNVAGLTVTVTSTNLGTVTVPLHNVNPAVASFNYTVPAGGPYTVRVAAGLYYLTYSTQITTTALKATNVSYTLPKSSGWIAGTVSPATGTVTVNGTAVTVGAGGSFNVTEPWGTYNVSGNLTGFTSAYNPSITVSPYQTAHVTLVLNGGLIAGAVAPLNASVQIDGVPQTLHNGQFTSAALTGGDHIVTATAPGYSYYHRDISVTAGAKTSITIVLTNQGWIAGTVTPMNGSIQINGQYKTVNPHTGAFNVTVAAGHTYNVTARANGYTQESRPAEVVSAGNVTPENFTLTQAPGCTSNCGPCTVNCGGNTGGGGTTPAANNLYLYLGIGAVIVVVAAVAVAMLMRRRGGSSPPPDEGSEADPSMDSGETTEGSNPPGNY